MTKKDKETNGYTHEAYYKKENVTSSSTGDITTISAQGLSAKEVFDMFKKIKEMMIT